MKIRKVNDKLPHVLIFQGSPRDPDTCPGMESKSVGVVNYILDKYSHLLDMEVIDLSVNQKKVPTIQPCKGCVSTAGGFHCTFPCSCYRKGSENSPDLLKELDVYEKLERCDAFLVVSPVHWYSLTSQVKLLFDRLVCINLTLRTEDALNLMGEGNTKNSDITGKFAKSGKWNGLLRNHLEGKLAGFYVHGDDGADDYSDRDLPPSYDVISDGFSKNPRSVIEPFIMQLKYSGIFVPDNMVQAFYVNRDINYYVANKNFHKESEFFERADELIKNLLGNLDI